MSFWIIHLSSCLTKTKDISMCVSPYMMVLQIIYVFIILMIIYRMKPWITDTWPWVVAMYRRYDYLNKPWNAMPLKWGNIIRLSLILRQLITMILRINSSTIQRVFTCLGYMINKYYSIVENLKNQVDRIK